MSEHDDTDRTRDVMKTYLRLLGENAAPEGIAELFAEDVDFDISGDTASVPWIGRREGRAGVAAFFADLRAVTQAEGFDVTKLVVDGDTAIIVGSLTTRVNATDRLIDSEFAIVTTIRDGMIARYRLLEDSFAVAEAVRAPAEKRREIVREYFRRVDDRDPSLADLYTDDVEFVYPKFGTHRGKAATAKFGAVMGTMLSSLEHDIEGLRFVEAGDTIIVEGRERGTLADGVAFPDGLVSEGRFCNVFTFRGDRIASVRVYVDPDLGSRDVERIQQFRAPAG